MKSVLTKAAKLLSKWRVLLLMAIIVLIIVVLYNLIGKDVKSDFPSAKVNHGDFLIELSSSGEIHAALSTNISAPSVRTNLQIIKLIPEGSVVKTGDFLIQFDPNELLKTIDDKQSELEIARANLEKSEASLSANMAQLKSSLETTLASYELAKLRLQQMAFEADVKVQEEKLRMRQAEIDLEQAKAKISSQEIMDKADLTTLKLKIQQAESELEKARDQVKQLTVNAPSPGLVVYQKMWKGESVEKIKVGDSPWRGQALIQLPDLSKMQVTCEISEVEIGNLKLEQTVKIKLDAFPDPTFHGKVTDISSLAHGKSGQEEIKVFDVIIDIDEADPILKPGMTAKAVILIEKIPDKTFVPIEAVFEKDGEKVVYVVSGKSKTVKVNVERRNENFVVVEGDLKAGQLVSLVDPRKAQEIEKSTAGKDTTKTVGIPEGGKSGRKGKRNRK